MACTPHPGRIQFFHSEFRAHSSQKLIAKKYSISIDGQVNAKC